MANQIGQALVGPPVPQQFVGPPAPASPLGAAVLSPPVPVRQPGQGVTPPANLNVLQKLLYALQNDPNFRKAVAVGGMTLGRTDKNDSGLTNLATGMQAGMSVLEQAREKEKADAAAAADKEAAVARDERKTRAAEKQMKITEEATRRQFLLSMESRANAAAEQKDAHEARMEQLAIQRAQLATAREAKNAGTKEDKQFLIARRYVEEQAKRAGVEFSPAELDKEAWAYQLSMTQKPSSGIDPSKFVGPALQGVTAAGTGRETPEEIASKSLDISKNIYEGLTGAVGEKGPEVGLQKAIADAKAKQMPRPQGADTWLTQQGKQLPTDFRQLAVRPDDKASYEIVGEDGDNFRVLVIPKAGGIPYEQAMPKSAVLARATRKGE